MVHLRHIIKKGGTSMASSDFRSHEKKKVKKSLLEKKAQRQTGNPSWQLPQVEIIKKGKQEW